MNNFTPYTTFDYSSPTIFLPPSPGIVTTELQVESDADVIEEYQVKIM